MCGERDFTSSGAQNISAATAGAGNDGDCELAVVAKSVFLESDKPQEGIMSLPLVVFEVVHVNSLPC